MNRLTSALLERLKHNTLGHFYVISAHPDLADPREYLDLWAVELLAHALVQMSGISLEQAKHRLQMGHPDILVLEKEDQTKNYSLEENELGELFRFQNFRAFETKHRFVLVKDAQLISVRYANKLLKTLEEPASDVTIIFLNPTRAQLLSTIESRAIHLRAAPSAAELSPLPQTRSAAEFFSQLAQQGPVPQGLADTLCALAQGELELNEAIEKIRKNRSWERPLLSASTDYMSSCEADYAQSQEYLKQIEWFYEAQTFHNSPPQRLAGLLSAIFPHVVE